MSERIAAGEIRTGTVTGERIDTDALPSSNERDRFREKGVRQWNELASPPPSLADLPNRPAHPSNRLIAQLNASWRVIDDPLQWILQRRKGNPRKKNFGWRSRSFCRSQGALLRCVREYCGEVDAEALSKLKSLPDWHLDWDRRNQRTNLDVRETDQAHAIEQSEPLVSQRLGAC